jgi:hypothetical protein
VIDYLDEVRKHVHIGGHSDVCRQPLYDSYPIKSAPFAAEFFSQPLGEHKAPADTNMYISNILVPGNSFYTTGIGVYFVPNIEQRPSTRSADLADVLCVLGHGHLQFRVGNRRYLELAPLGAAPPPFPMYWGRDLPALEKMMNEPTKADSEGAKKIGLGFELVPIYIASQQYFGVTVRIDNCFKLNNPGRLGVMLDGALIREAQ